MIVALMSGGIDSTVLASLIKKQHEKIHSIFVDYGQRNFTRECNAYHEVCEYLDIEPHIIDVAPLFNDIRAYGKDSRWSVMRNTALISIAGCYSTSLDSEGVAYAGHMTDGVQYTDCTVDFVEQYGQLLSTVTNRSRRLFAPFIQLRKADIITLGQELNAPLHLTYSCYSGEEEECHQCIACVEKYKALEELKNGRSN